MKCYLLLMLVFFGGCRNIKETKSVPDISLLQPNPSEWIVLAKVVALEENENIKIEIQDAIKKGMGTSAILSKGDVISLIRPNSTSPTMKKDQIVAVRLVESLKFGANTLPDFQIVEIILK